MTSYKGFIIPIIALLTVLIVGGVVYHYSDKGTQSSSTPAAVVSAIKDDEPVTVKPTSNTANVTDASVFVTPEPTTPVVTSSNDTGLVQVTTAGTLAQRYNLETLTNTDYSYAISFPQQWSSSGASSLVTVTNGRSSIVIASQAVAAGINAATFAAQSGATNGFITTKVNGYTAYETIVGNQNTYYIVNGSVGYKMVVTDLGDTNTLETILLTFTVTKQR